MVHRWSLRVRVALFFGLTSLTPVVLMTAVVLMSSDSPDAQSLHELKVLAMAVATVSALLGFVVWRLFDQHVARALQGLARELQCHVHTPESSPLDTDRVRYLGPVGAASQSLIDALNQHRTQARAHLETAEQPLREESELLATLIRDVPIGIIVASREDRIVLYNARAAHCLDGDRQLGLSRALSDFIRLAPIRQALRSRTESDAPSQDSAELTLESASADRSFTGTVSALYTDAAQLRGYLLCFADPVESGSEHHRTDSTHRATLAIKGSRPEFYDFDLFDRTTPGSLAEQALERLDYVVFDTETTGLEPNNGDRIVSLAAVRIVNGRVMTGETFDVLVNPDRSIPAASTRFHGIRDDQVRDEPGIETVLPRFERFVGDAVLVAHNAAFDMAFLSAASTSCGVRLDNPVLDTVLLSAWLHDHSERHTLDDLAERFGVEIEGRHTALGDTLATAEILVRMWPQLRARGVRTLGEALSVSDRMVRIKHAQRAYDS